MIVSIFNYHFILSYYHVVYHMLLSSCWGKISVEIIEKTAENICIIDVIFVYL